MRQKKRTFTLLKPGSSAFRDGKGLGLCDDDPYDDDEEEFWDDEDDESGPEGSGFATEADGPPSIGVCAIDTGLLNASGQPVIRHPVRVRPGFHPPSRQFHVPTSEDDADGSGSVVGWAYEF